MYTYAQLDEAHVVVAVSRLSGEVTAAHMVLLAEGDDVQPRDIRNPDGTWTRPEPPVVPPIPSTAERLEQLEQENLSLMEAMAELYELLLANEGGGAA
ncbi:hypothetical protein IDH44_14690 [Paenibacillus sp. IB182496]|uniref:Uncharacterized protein n=1 Tax=Paenibacillus sabuli TaxID=2772509 RepID=A0A927BTE1_9BACL|nr:hypothetical protein [Paenibacillus sabuli]MBD2846446.1 hypothetical protein [Paenibacillus sabuli]